MKKILAAILVAVAIPALAADKMEKQDKAIRDSIAAFQDAWNKHDYKAMAGFWADDGDIINPWGRMAKGKAEVEKLFQDEQMGMLKTTQQHINVNSIRFLDKDAAVVDADASMSGVMTPDGKPAPDFQHHITLVLQNVKGKFLVASGRPYQYMAQPAAPTPA